MNALATAICWVILTIAIHLLIWRIFRPKSPARTACLCAFMFFSYGILFAQTYLNQIEIVYTVALSTVLFCAYIISIPGIESESPSSLIALFIHQRGHDGASEEDLRALITDEIFVLDRLQGLLREGLVEKKDDRFIITPAGESFLAAFTVFHKIAGINKEGG